MIQGDVMQSKALPGNVMHSEAMQGDALPGAVPQGGSKATWCQQGDATAGEAMSPAAHALPSPPRWRCFI